jgi:hypothetical protein
MLKTSKTFTRLFEALEQALRDAKNEAETQTILKARHQLLNGNPEPAKELITIPVKKEST